MTKELDFDSGAPSDVPFLYKNKNLTTHGVIIGMTGSGKTGLGVGLIEEAIMDNVPSIVIDPKGDMGNLLLTFPESKPEDFTPWIDPAEAARKEMSVNEFAAATAQNWKEGLSTWGQGTKRIESLRSKTTMTIYTPGSSAGMPVSVLTSSSLRFLPRVAPAYSILWRRIPLDWFRPCCVRRHGNPRISRSIAASVD